VAFGQLAGGVLCKDCRVGKRQVASVSAAVIETLETFSSTDEQEHQSTKLDPAVRGELRGVLNHYLNNLLGHRLRMQTYLGVLAK
jgi:hypothetical protein